MNRTFSIIKPDATKRNITGEINRLIENNNLRIIAQKRIKLSSDKAEDFYSIHKEKPFFNDLIQYMTSEPVIVQVLQGDDAVSKYRNLMGSTNPKDAEAEQLEKNLVLMFREFSTRIRLRRKRKKIEYFLKKMK